MVYQQEWEIGSEKILVKIGTTADTDFHARIST